MNIIREAQQKWAPWKNGGGETVEIAHGPSGSTLENFDWRISRARVERPGPFSFFPGIDRTLAVIQGDALELRFDQDIKLMSVDTPPLSFGGEARVESQVRQPITDLNVMTRRGRYRHRMSAIAEGEPVSCSAKSSVMTAIFTTGDATLRWSSSAEQIHANDAVFPASDDGIIEVTPGGLTRLYLIEIWVDGG